jgi:hypothetical protein
MELNKTNVDARQLTYIDLPTKYVWKAEKKLWAKRRRGFAIGRIYNCNTPKQQ